MQFVYAYVHMCEVCVHMYAHACGGQRTTSYVIPQVSCTIFNTRSLVYSLSNTPVLPTKTYFVLHTWLQRWYRLQRSSTYNDVNIRTRFQSINWRNLVKKIHSWYWVVVVWMVTGLNTSRAGFPNLLQSFCVTLREPWHFF